MYPENYSTCIGGYYYFYDNMLSGLFEYDCCIKNKDFMLQHGSVRLTFLRLKVGHHTYKFKFFRELCPFYIPERKFQRIDLL